jgi:hypothetical protein
MQGVVQQFKLGLGIIHKVVVQIIEAVVKAAALDIKA